MSADVGSENFVPEPELRLEAPEVVNVRAAARAETRKHYQQPFAVYVKRFGLQAKDSERALKRWVAKGREADPPDYPPFDEPHLLGAWWRRHMVWRVPAWMELLEQVGPEKAASETLQEKAAEASGQPAEKVEKVAGGSPPDLPPGFALDELPEDAGDAEKELWKLANGFKLQMEQAIKANDMSKWWPAYNEYSKVLKQLRVWEKDRAAKRLSEGKALDVAKMSEILSTMFGVVSKAYLQGLLSLAKKVNPKLSDEEVRALVYPVRDEVFRGLKASRFATAMPAEVIA